MPNNNNPQVVNNNGNHNNANNNGNNNNNNGSPDDMKDDRDYTMLKWRFERLRDKIQNDNDELKKETWNAAKKIVLDAIYQRYIEDWNADHFYREEGDEVHEIFYGRDAVLEAEGLVMSGYDRADVKQVLTEMIDALNPNLTGGRRRKHKSRRKNKKSKKTHRRRK